MASSFSFGFSGDDIDRDDGDGGYRSDDHPTHDTGPAISEIPKLLEARSHTLEELVSWADSIFVSSTCCSMMLRFETLVLAFHCSLQVSFNLIHLAMIPRAVDSRARGAHLHICDISSDPGWIITKLLSLRKAKSCSASPGVVPPPSFATE